MGDVLLYAACNASVWEETVEVHKNGDNHNLNLKYTWTVL